MLSQLEKAFRVYIFDVWPSYEEWKSFSHGKKLLDNRLDLLKEGIQWVKKNPLYLDAKMKENDICTFCKGAISAKERHSNLKEFLEKKNISKMDIFLLCLACSCTKSTSIQEKEINEFDEKKISRDNIVFSSYYFFPSLF